MPGQLRSNVTCPVCGLPLDALTDSTDSSGVKRKYYHGKDPQNPKLRCRNPCKMFFDSLEVAQTERRSLEVEHVS
jgi:hypothetical protein